MNPSAQSADGRLALVVFSALKARNLTALLDEICQHRGVMTYEVCGRARTRGVCYARQELWWRIRNHTERHYSLSEIATLFRRDHATVRQGIAAHQKRTTP